MDKMSLSAFVILVLAVAGSNGLSIIPARRPGTCPRYLTYRPCVLSYAPKPTCTFDFHCPTGQKCCQSGCGKTCQRVPTRPVCPYLSESICGLNCRSRGGLVTDSRGCKVCQCARCPPNTPVTSCFANPCQVNKCKRYPTAQCVASFCGGCNANFFVNGRKVECAVRPPPPPTCRLYERYTRCGGACQPHCGRTAVCKACRPGCSCIPGYIKRSANGLCIRKSSCPTTTIPVPPINCAAVLCRAVNCPGAVTPPGQCCAVCPKPPTCGRYERYTACGGICQPTCASSIVCLACGPGCSCIPGYVKRSANGPCIPRSKCPTTTPTCGVNAEYTPCGGVCQPHCGSTIQCRAACRPGCSCKTGYIKKTANGRCVRKSQCPSQRCPRHEVYSSCAGTTACQPTCTSRGCLTRRRCVPGCKCKPRYVRRSAYGKCMPKSRCPRDPCLSTSTRRTSRRRRCYN